MPRHGLLALGLAQALACGPTEHPPDPEGGATLTFSQRDPQLLAIRLDGEPLGALRRDGSRSVLTGRGVVAWLERSEEPLDVGRPYPRRVRLEGRLEGLRGSLRQEYTLLAPPAPLSVEGLGLEVSSDEPGLNRAEQRELTAWLGEQGLAPDTSVFEALHQADTGRELRVWYEISGRRVDGRLGRDGAAEPLARVDSLFRSEEGSLKIHHERPGENGRFTYHRQSLELADSISSRASGLPPLQAHQCGCYGYAIAADFMTLGRRLYHVEADWLDDRVAADFFVGFEVRERFPWLGIGDRRRMRDLARRVKAFLLEDAGGARFAEVRLELPEDPPSPDLGQVTYRVDL